VLLTKEGDAFGRWSRAFATRTFPALIADPAAVSKIRRRADQAGRLAEVRIACLYEDLARQYYGLKPARGRLEPDGTKGLISIGAHPLYSVISGALLCMSRERFSTLGSPPSQSSNAAPPSSKARCATSGTRRGCFRTPLRCRRRCCARWAKAS
jgi:hypothetical protein